MWRQMPLRCAEEPCRPCVPRKIPVTAACERHRNRGTASVVGRRCPSCPVRVVRRVQRRQVFEAGYSLLLRLRRAGKCLSSLYAPSDFDVQASPSVARGGSTTTPRDDRADRVHLYIQSRSQVCFIGDKWVTHTGQSDTHDPRAQQSQVEAPGWFRPAPPKCRRHDQRLAASLS